METRIKELKNKILDKIEENLAKQFVTPSDLSQYAHILTSLAVDNAKLYEGVLSSMEAFKNMQYGEVKDVEFREISE